MLAAALDFSAIGWRVFPVAADGRSPLVEGGCHAASADPGKVRRWWSAPRPANIALACGPESGVLALDIDRKGDIDGFAELRTLEREFAPLPSTVRSETPSGGAHLLFRHPDGPSPSNRVGIKRWSAEGARTIYRGLDVRAAGASICLPPSRKTAGGYAWSAAPWVADLADVPPWLLALMRSEPPAAPPRPILQARSTDRLARYVCAAVEGECQAVATTAAGNGRNQRLFIAAAQLGGLVGANVLAQDTAEGALERAAADCGLTQEDGLHAVRATIASGLKRGIAQPRELGA